MSAYLLTGPNTHTSQNSVNLEANRCPADNGGCCLDCEHNQYCPKNQGCYSADQSGCDDLCPPLAQVRPRTTTSAPIWSRLLRDCSFHECEQSGCDRVANPFLCVTVEPPAPYMGCSSVPWPEAACPNACSIEQCSKVVPSLDEPTCQVRCPAAWCAQINSPVPQQRCSADAPFQCLAGSAAKGCAADQYHFASVSDTMCSSCCDVSSCR